MDDIKVDEIKVDDDTSTDTMGGLQYPDSHDEHSPLLSLTASPAGSFSIEENAQRAAIEDNAPQRAAPDRHADFSSIKLLIEKATWRNGFSFYR